MSGYLLEDGTRLLGVHSPERCEGHHCVIHNPSDHHMKDWPRHWFVIGVAGRGFIARRCPHNNFHPDPDDIAFYRSISPVASANLINIHNCDGCCRREEGQ